MNDHQHTHGQNRFAVLPTALRLQLDSDERGKGVTIAFLDSGFYPHPDLTMPKDRIVAYHDVTDPSRKLTAGRPLDEDWHGTMTSVVAAGNGYLSEGTYRGLASESNLVLVKISDGGRITEENIAKGLAWIIANRDRFGIQIVSISVGGAADVSYKQNEVDALAEEAIRNGILVVAAAGNAGCSDHHLTVPPANSPGVITVGGYDDQNRLTNDDPQLYCSSFGGTADGILKPEILAPAMWVAAPILPGTKAYERAAALTELMETPDYALHSIASRLRQSAGLAPLDTLRDAAALRAEIDNVIRESKIISAHYQYADGTSFAAPVVASLIALMLQANHGLRPATVKNLLIATAQRIRNAPAVRQGYGMLNAPAALKQAQQEIHIDDSCYFQAPRVHSEKLIFFYHDDSAQKVELSGAFWNWGELRSFERNSHGIWRAEILLPKPGRYSYKFLINGTRWIEDPNNGLKEPDNFGGFHSILHVL